MRYLSKFNSFNEDIRVDKFMYDHLRIWTDENYKKDLKQIFSEDFIQNISNLCLELDDLGYIVNIRFPQYHKEGSNEILPCLCVDIDSQAGYFINNEVLEMTVKEIQNYVSDFDLSVDVELGSDDQFVTADEFISTYNTEELDVISLLIY